MAADELAAVKFCINDAIVFVLPLEVFVFSPSPTPQA